MRYSKINSSQFSRFGETKTIKDIFKFPNPLVTTSSFSVPTIDKMQLDKMAAELFGANQENLWWLIAAKNVNPILGWKADFSKINSLDIPNKREYE